MKLKYKNTKKSSVSHKTLPNQFTNYLINPRQFLQSLIIYEPKNLNPLYSKQSFHKYFGQIKQQKYKQPSQQFVTKRNKSQIKNPNIAKFNQLKQMLRKQSEKGYKKKLKNEVQKFANQIQKQVQHFKNLNWDDGISPLNEFSLCNLRIKHYLDDLSHPKVNSKFWRYQKARTQRQKIHTENIKEYIKKQNYQSRYKAIPQSSEEIQQKKQIQSWQRDNMILRSKTMYCRTQYKPPFIKKNKLDQQILAQSKRYMKRKLNQSTLKQKVK